MRRNPVAHKLEAVANVSDQKAHSALVWMAEKARQVNPRSTPIQYQFQGKIPLHMLKSITEVKGRGKGYTVRRSGKKVTVTSTGTPDSYCWIIEAEAPTKDKKVPIVFVIHEYPKRKKNPPLSSAILERAVRAGADPKSTQKIDEGMEGHILIDKTGRVFKVGKRKSLKNEALATKTLASYGLAPKVYKYDEKENVIVRDYIDGTPGAWGNAKMLHSLYDEIVGILKEEGFTAPEFKENSFIVTSKGRAFIVDVGFVHLRGKRLAQALRKIDPTSYTQWGEAFNLQLDILGAVEDGALSSNTAKKMLENIGNKEIRHHSLEILRGRVKGTKNPKRPRNPKRRKNPKFKVGDRVIEGKRKGKVTALHSPGTVDVLFDDMSYAIRRQAPNVRKR